MKALAWKELRETLSIAVIAMLGYAALLVNLMGGRVFYWVPGLPKQPENVPFVSGDFVSVFTVLSFLLAVALGFRQSVWESSRGTYLFLLHRPLPRNAIFLTKLATGLALLLFCASMPIVLYGVWAMTPGSHAGPFEWSMTVSAWRMLLMMPLVYLGAFLSGLRPAHWFGTRLLPLIASLALLILMSMLREWFLVLPLSLTLCGLLIVNVCFVARARDYA